MCTMQIPLNLRGLEQFDVAMIIEILIDLLPLSIDVNVKLSLMRICLKITRHYPHAKYFAQHGGIEALLRLRRGHSNLLQMALLLIRHTLEEPRTLELAMESVISSRLSSNVPAGYRDVIYMTRQLSAAVIRSPDTYVKVAKRILVLDPAVPVRRPPANTEEADQQRYLVKVIPGVTNTKNYTVDDRVVYDVITALLSAVFAPEQQTAECYPEESNQATISSAVDEDEAADSCIIRLRLPCWQNGEEEQTTTKTTPNDNRPLLSKSVLLRFLSDLVKSYQTIALIVAEYTIPRDESLGLDGKTSLLAYLMDTFIPTSEANRDRECNASARMLISALAAMSNVSKIQGILIDEVRAALVRTWQIDDMTKKCVQIQLLAQLIPVLIESSPPESPVLMTTSGLRQQLMMPQRNSMFHSMVQKNLIEDLARITQQMDFTNPQAVSTLNSALKPLETLLRLNNQPTLSIVARRSGTRVRVSRRTVSTRSGADEPSRNVDFTVESVLVTQGSADRGISAPPSEGVVAAPAAGAGGLGGWGEAVEVENEPGWSDVYALESSSGSEESESNGGDENAEPGDMENEEEDEHEEAEPEEPSEVDVNDESRQFIEIFDQHTNSGRRLSSLTMREAEDPFIPFGDRVSSGQNATLPVEGDDTRTFHSPRVYFHSIYEAGANENAEENSRMSTRASRDSGSSPTTASNLQFLMGNSSSSSQNFLLEAGGSSNSAQRTNRMRRYQYLRSIAARNTTHPVILQRLLGPSSHAAAPSPTFRDASRVVLMDNGIEIFSPSTASGAVGGRVGEDGTIDIIDRGDYMLGRNLSTQLNTTPNVLTAWTEEFKLLGLESQPDICMYACVDILKDLEANRAVQAQKKRKPSAEAKNKPASASQSTESLGGATIPETITLPDIRVQQTSQPVSENDSTPSEVTLRTTLTPANPTNDQDTEPMAEIDGTASETDQAPSSSELETNRIQLDMNFGSHDSILLHETGNERRSQAMDLMDPMVLNTTTSNNGTDEMSISEGDDEVFDGGQREEDIEEDNEGTLPPSCREAGFNMF
ncbi:E3 ubiquitin-protein ligase HUWE1 [Sergentomyia squamirostris]